MKMISLKDRKSTSFFDFSVMRIKENGKTISLLSVIIPHLCNFLFTRLLGSINTLMLSGYADNAVGATSTALQIINVVVLLMNLSGIGGSILVAIEFGRGDVEKAAKITGATFIMTAIISITASIILFLFARPLLVMMNLDGEILDYGVTYLKIRGGLLFILGINSCINTFLICSGHTIHSMINGVGSNVLSTLFSYLLLKRAIIPSISGTAAVAISSMLACFISLIYMIVVFIKVKCPIKFSFERKVLKDIYSLAIPGSLSDFSYAISQAITASFMALIGAVALNAKSYVTEIIQYTYVISSGFSVGMKVLMGRYAGRRDFESMKKLSRMSLAITISASLMISFLFLMLRRPIMSVFTDDVDIISIALPIFIVDIFVEIFRSINSIIGSSLNASLDVRTTLIAGIISSWCGSVLLAYILAVYFNMGLLGLWIAFMTDEAIKATIFLIRWKRKKWKAKLIAKTQ